MLLGGSLTRGAGLGDVRGLVLDPTQHPVSAAKVTLKARTSSYLQTGQTNGNGEFAFRAVPLGEYLITVESSGFTKLEQPVTVISDSAPVLKIQLQIRAIAQGVDVIDRPELVGSDSPTPTTLISRRQIEQTPGADRSNSLAMITNYVPGAYMTHDQLHLRGGHQVTWLIDGVPIPNTNIASNIGPQFDPKDIDYLEVQRGGYSAEYGDRTYGVFNIVPRSGFERNREAELTLSYGSFHQTNNQLSFGSHQGRFAYFASINGNRSDYGLAAPGPQVLHDQGNGLGGFASFIYDATPADQLRLVTGLRRDFYQVPNDADAQDTGIRDAERESDGFVNFSWVRTLNSKMLLTVSPFYHFNRADFEGDVNDTPVIPREKRDSQYAGGQATLSLLTRQHNAKAGFYGFYQDDVQLFSLQANDGSGQNLLQRDKPRGHLAAAFLEDQFKPTNWLTLTAGIRFTHFESSVSENIGSPRVGAAVRLPRLRWVLRAFYGRYYQAPPLSTVAGPFIDFALDQGFAFLPLRGERDEEKQFGLTIPLRGWTLDTDYFRTGVKNLFDHNAIAESNIFFPLTIERGRIRGWEVTLNSPRLLRRAQAHLAYARLRIEGQGTINGGLTDFSPPAGYFPLDHDQRHTLNVGGEVSLPRRSFVAANVYYGSGFLDGEGPEHLPGHTTVDLSVGKSFREKLSVAVHALNAANRRFLLDNSETFGGTHYADPRQVYVAVRYRFNY
ncbi:MAG: TonB-dependent receptor [Blastocatellia bacterium]|nr:TonB-dependent receptor [Blastocatellia bacterium]